jgi:mRNA interferase MazF
MTKVTVAPITTTIKGLSSEVLLGPDNGLDHDCVVALDNVITVPVHLLGRTIGYLNDAQEAHLSRVVALTYDLELPPSGMTRRATCQRHERNDSPCRV